LSGPTLFGPLIQQATAIAAGANCSQQQQKYTVLLILTDGLINDMESTIQSVINASAHPLSIIIIGVGNENFSGMKVLDADGQRLKMGANTAARDIVQFVPFADYVTKGAVALAEDTLKEVPTQVLEFMAQRRIVPNPPIPGNMAPPPL
jgi:ribulose kinase